LNNVSFVFQTGSTLTTASGSSVNSINLGTNDSIYWAIGSSATLGTTTAFEGFLIANQSITMTTGATIGCGSAIALNGAVTLDSNVIGNGCSTGDGSGSGTPSAVPEPETLALFATGLLGAGMVIRRRFAA
jgi:type VI secretion system secreted protein VgrG